MLKKLLKALRKQQVRILVLGLDNSGKSTIIQRMELTKKVGRKQAEASINSSSNSHKILHLKSLRLLAFALRNYRRALPCFTKSERESNCQVKNLIITCYDMSGQSQYRSLWERYYAKAEAIIFVIDSSDRYVKSASTQLQLNWWRRIRTCIAKSELDELLKHPDLIYKPIPLLFFANKMDVAGALTPIECSQELELQRISDRPWHIACGASADGAV